LSETRGVSVVYRSGEIAVQITESN